MSEENQNLDKAHDFTPTHTIYKDPETGDKFTIVTLKDTAVANWKHHLDRKGGNDWIGRAGIINASDPEGVVFVAGASIGNSEQFPGIKLVGPWIVYNEDGLQLVPLREKYETMTDEAKKEALIEAAREVQDLHSLEISQGGNITLDNINIDENSGKTYLHEAGFSDTYLPDFISDVQALKSVAQSIGITVNLDAVTTIDEFIYALSPNPSSSEVPSKDNAVLAPIPTMEPHLIPAEAVSTEELVPPLEETELFEDDIADPATHYQKTSPAPEVDIDDEALVEPLEEYEDFQPIEDIAVISETVAPEPIEEPSIDKTEELIDFIDEGEGHNISPNAADELVDPVDSEAASETVLEETVAGTEKHAHKDVTSESELVIESLEQEDTSPEHVVTNPVFETKESHSAQEQIVPSQAPEPIKEEHPNVDVPSNTEEHLDFLNIRQTQPEDDMSIPEPLIEQDEIEIPAPIIEEEALPEPIIEATSEQESFPDPIIESNEILSPAPNAEENIFVSLDELSTPAGEQLEEASSEKQVEQAPEPYLEEANTVTVAAYQHQDYAPAQQAGQESALAEKQTVQENQNHGYVTHGKYQVQDSTVASVSVPKPYHAPQAATPGAEFANPAYSNPSEYAQPEAYKNMDGAPYQEPRSQFVEHKEKKGLFSSFGKKKNEKEQPAAVVSTSKEDEASKKATDNSSLLSRRNLLIGAAAVCAIGAGVYAKDKFSGSSNSDASNASSQNPGVKQIAISGSDATTALFNYNTQATWTQKLGDQTHVFVSDEALVLMEKNVMSFYKIGDKSKIRDVTVDASPTLLTSSIIGNESGIIWRINNTIFAWVPSLAGSKDLIKFDVSSNADFKNTGEQILLVDSQKAYIITTQGKKEVKYADGLSPLAADKDVVISGDFDVPFGLTKISDGTTSNVTFTPPEQGQIMVKILSAGNGVASFMWGSKATPAENENVTIALHSLSDGSVVGKYSGTYTSLKNQKWVVGTNGAEAAFGNAIFSIGEKPSLIGLTPEGTVIEKIRGTFALAATPDEASKDASQRSKTLVFQGDKDGYAFNGFVLASTSSGAVVQSGSSVKLYNSILS